MTRDDILRRLAEGIATSCARAPQAHASHTLSLLRALAREPGGAEAVAEAVGVRFLCRTCKGAGLVRVTPGCTCGGIDIGVGTMHEPYCGMDRCDCTYLPAPQFGPVAADCTGTAPKEPTP